MCCFATFYVVKRMANTFIVDSNGGISGSLTQLVNGTSYLIAGANVAITSQSNGQVMIGATSTGLSVDRQIFTGSGT